MSFFKDLKEDVGVMGDFENDDNQMVDTLSGSSSDDFDEFNLSEEDALGVDDDMIEKMQDEDSLNLENEEVAAEDNVYSVPEYQETAYVEESEPETTDEEETFPATENNLYTGDIVESHPGEFAEADGSTTVISKGTVIQGSIVSDGSLDVYGTVNGDISCLGKLSISGAVKGKSSAAEVYLHTNKLDGGITSKGCVKIAAGTVVIGDIAASSCVVAGAVKGNLDVNGPVVVDSTAVIKGNISSKGIQINSGAVIDGFCALPYASVDIDSFFGDEVDA